MRVVARAGMAVTAAVVLCGLVACGPDGGGVPGTSVSTGASVSPETPGGEMSSPEDYAAELFELTNVARTAEGQPALAWSECAREQGATRAQTLDDAGEELVHAPLGPVIAACAPVSTAGENLSRASLGPGAVVDAWMQSPGHRENIVTPDFTELGIACVLSGEGGGAGEADEAGEQMLCAQIFLG